MLHQFDSNAIAHQQQLNQQFFQQQQQQQQQHQNPTNASKHVVAPGHEPGFSHDSHGHGHGHDHGQATDSPDQDFSHTAPSPLMLQPTILPSQPLPPSSPLHRVLAPHPHMMHHQRSVFELQHAYQQQHQALLQQQQQQQQQAMDQHEQHTGASERGRKGTAETGYHRKRSLSVPLLLSLNPSHDPKSQQGASGDQRRPVVVSSDSQSRQLLPHTGGGGRRGGEGERGGGQDHDGDQDMDMDDGHHANSSQQQDQKASKASPLTIDYSEMILPRETLLATVPRTYSHRVYAGHGVYHHSSNNHSHHDHGNSTNSGTLYYNHGHISSHPHHHFSLRSRHHHHHHHLHYNPFLNRKFPPYKYWAISAQRDYHLSRIGILVGRPGTSSSSASGMSAASSSSPSSSAALVTTATTSGGGPPPGAGGDLMLRTALGSAGGGVTKTHYRSRLPVHLRHMTSRPNRRPAICGNPFQDDARAQQGSSSGGRSTDDPRSVSQENSQSLLSSLSISGSTATAAATSTATASGGGSDAGQRRRLSDWKRVTALNLDLEDDPRGGMIMRLASQDRVTPVGNSSRHWMNQRGGLANLMQGSSTRVGSSSASGSTGRDTTGTSGGGGSSTSTVDRLVEEMNKWSV